MNQKLEAVKLTKHEIEAIQAGLNKILGLKLKITGNLDKETINAIKQFQSKHELVASGIFDEETRKKFIETLEQFEKEPQTEQMYNDILFWYFGTEKEMAWSFEKEIPTWFLNALTKVDSELRARDGRGLIIKKEPPVTRVAEGEVKIIYTIVVEREGDLIEQNITKFLVGIEQLLKEPAMRTAYHSIQEVYETLRVVEEVDKRDLSTEIERIRETLKKAKINDEIISELLKGTNIEIIGKLRDFCYGLHISYSLQRAYENVKSDPLNTAYHREYENYYILYRDGSEHFKHGVKTRIKEAEALLDFVRSVHLIKTNLEKIRELASMNPTAGTAERAEFDKIVSELSTKTGAEQEILKTLSEIYFRKNFETIIKEYRALMDNENLRIRINEIQTNPIFSDIRSEFNKLDLEVKYYLLLGEFKVPDEVKEGYGRLLVARKDPLVMKEIISSVTKVNKNAQLEYIHYTLPALLLYASPGVKVEIEIEGRKEMRDLFHMYVAAILIGEGNFVRPYNLTREIEDMRNFYKYLPQYIYTRLNREVAKQIGSWIGYGPEEQLKSKSKFEKEISQIAALPLPFRRDAKTESRYVPFERLTSWYVAVQALEIYTDYLADYPPAIWAEFYYLVGLDEAVRNCVGYVHSLRDITPPKFNTIYAEAAGTLGSVPEECRSAELKLGAAGPTSAVEAAIREKQGYIRALNISNIMNASASWDPKFFIANLDYMTDSKDNVAVLYRQTDGSYYADYYARTATGWLHMKTRVVTQEEYVSAYARAKGIGADVRFKAEVLGKEAILRPGFLITYYARQDSVFSALFSTTVPVDVMKSAAAEKRVQGTTIDDVAIGWVKERLGPFGQLRLEFRRPVGKPYEGGFKFSIEDFLFDIYSTIEMEPKYGGRVLVDKKDCDLEARGYKLLDEYAAMLTARYGKLGSAFYGWSVAQVISKENNISPAFINRIKIGENEYMLGFTPEAQLARFLRDKLSTGFARWKKEGGASDNILDFVSRYTGEGVALKFTLQEQKVPEYGVKIVLLPIKYHLLPEKLRLDLPLLPELKFALRPEDLKVALALTVFAQEQLRGIGYLVGGHFYPFRAISSILLHTAEMYTKEDPTGKWKCTHWNLGYFLRNWERGGLYLVYDHQSDRVILAGDEEIAKELDRLKGGWWGYKFTRDGIIRWDTYLTGKYDRKTEEKLITVGGAYTADELGKEWQVGGELGYKSTKPGEWELIWKIWIRYIWRF